VHRGGKIRIIRKVIQGEGAKVKTILEVREGESREELGRVILLT